MYESPVNLMIQDIETQIVQKQEQTILDAITKCGVVVDKDELIKAINYDRNQYSKGYKDGVDDVINKITTDIELHRRKTESIDNYDLVGDCLEIIDKYRTERENHWINIAEDLMPIIDEAESGE